MNSQILALFALRLATHKSILFTLSLIALGAWFLIGRSAVGGSSETPREISYISERDNRADIWSMDLDTLTERRLTHVTCAEGSIDAYDWSPDGSAVAYVEVCSQQVQLKLLQVEIGNTYVISNIADSAIPSWHPYGTQVVFGTSSTQEHEGTIFIADVTDLDHIVVEELDSQLDCMGDCLNVLWSSDGIHLAFYGPPLSPNAGVGSSRSNVSVYDTSSRTLLSIGVYDIFPYDLSWSHEGSYLAIAAPSGRGTASFGLVGIHEEDQVIQYPQIRGADTDAATNEAFGAGFYHPHFSADDSLVALMSPSPTSEYPPDPVGGIYILNTQDLVSDDVPSFTTLVTPDENCAMPRWSPTSPDELIYVCGVGTASEIWSSNLRQDVRQQVTHNRFEEILPRWRPS